MLSIKFNINCASVPSSAPVERLFRISVISTTQQNDQWTIYCLRERLLTYSRYLDVTYILYICRLSNGLHFMIADCNLLFLFILSMHRPKTCAWPGIYLDMDTLKLGASLQQRKMCQHGNFGYFFTVVHADFWVFLWLPHTGWHSQKQNHETNVKWSDNFASWKRFILKQTDVSHLGAL